MSVCVTTSYVTHLVDRQTADAPKWTIDVKSASSLVHLYNFAYVALFHYPIL